MLLSSSSVCPSLSTQVKEWRKGLGVHVGGMKTWTTATVKVEGTRESLKRSWSFADTCLPCLCWGLKSWAAYYLRSPPALSHLDSVNRSQHNILPCRCAKVINLTGIYGHNYFQQPQTTIQVYVYVMWWIEPITNRHWKNKHEQNWTLLFHLSLYFKYQRF